MKRKIIGIIFAITVALCSLALTGCASHEHTFGTDYAKDNEYHWYPATCEHSDEVKNKEAHTYGEWEISVPSTCSNVGKEKRFCVCGAFEERETQFGDHIYSQEWSKNDEYHWHQATCSHTEIVTDKSTHVFGDWTVETPATCEEVGKEVRSCDCGQTEMRDIAVLPHSYADEWSKDQNFHWYQATCVHSQEISQKANHTFGDDNICDVCQYQLAYTEGLEFTLSDNPNLTADEQYYIVTGIGQSTSEILNIPSQYSGKPVKEIGVASFNGNDTITKVYIPNSVTVIGSSCFLNCHNLDTVILGNGITRIDNDAFGNCANLSYAEYNGTVDSWATIKFGNESSNPHPQVVNGQKISNITVTVEKISSYAFSGWSFITDITFENTVTIGKGAFKFCGNITNLVLPDTLITIEDEAFDNCMNLQTVSIPSGIQVIGVDAFRGPEYGGQLVTTDDGVIKYLGNEQNPYLYAYGLVGEMGSEVVLHEDTKIIAGWLFSSEKTMQTITIGRNVKHIGKEAFKNCTSLATVNYLGTIDEWAGITFVNANSNPIKFSKNLVINGGKVEGEVVISQVESIGAYAFYGYDPITTLVLKDKVTTVGEYAFTNCKIKTVKMGLQIERIGDYVFQDCSDITKVYYGGSNTDWGKIEFGWNNHSVDTYATLYYNQEI